ncbi:hypothetical protein EDF56_10396 [Novosphingobium sp. PhB165]|uniref:hypothetical protein n=1 Tax=Novosphingobium sp. PhB165 TaxID=2485105 RepID=UPI001048C679|nr:hypothetical protein [Novosphingobium sp. PhB165]TCM19460.1 hypothetical protein EDF56_10396 [Novosphingobium sp. PhB165]
MTTNETDPARDPARRRWATIQLVRIFGVACVVGGMMIGSGKLNLPLWVGYVLIANGLVDVFVIPTMLVRKWRSQD